MDFFFSWEEIQWSGIFLKWSVFSKQLNVKLFVEGGELSHCYFCTSLDLSLQHLESIVEHNCTQECSLILKTFLSIARKELTFARKRKYA